VPPARGLPIPPGRGRGADVHSRIERRFFVPVRSTDTAAGGAYVGAGGPDRAGRFDRTHAADERSRASNGMRGERAPAPRTNGSRNGFTFAVPRDLHALVEVTDSESKRSTTDRSRRVRVHPSGAGDSGTRMPSLSIPSPAGRPGYPPHPQLRRHVLFGSVVSLYAELPGNHWPTPPSTWRCDSR